MKKTIQIYEFELPVTVKKDKSGGYVAQCNVWQDCYAQGDSVEDAVSEISRVSSSLIELYQEEKLVIPLKKKKISPGDSSFKLNFPIIVSTS